MSNAAPKSSAMHALVIVASLVVIVAGMKAAASILVPFLLAVFIAVITAPLFLAFQRWGVPPAVALLLMILILAIIGFVGVAVVRTSLVGFSDNLARYQTLLEERTEGLWKRLEDLGITLPEKTVSEVFSPRVVMGYVGTVAGTLSGLLTNAFLILLVVVFILLEAAMLPAKVDALPGMSDARRDGLRQAVEDVRRYVSVKTLTSLLTGILVGILTALLRVDYPILLGLLAFLLNYVPNVGSFIAAIPGVLLAFIEFGLGTAGATVLGYIVINTAVGNLMEPRLMGRQLGLSPLVILLSMIFWGWVLGAVGMLLSVPLTMTAKIAMENGDQTRWIALLMGSGPPSQDAGENPL